jgi:predicted Kef-type K+ transport protein
MMQHYIIDSLWLGIAFLSGLIARRAGLPALIGFLVTGILLSALNIQEGNLSSVISILSDLGIMLLLFTIGLKIKIQSLLKREVWFTATAHMIISVLAIGSIIFALSFIPLRAFTSLSVKACFIIGFALSFSSTVFAAKILEERGELSSYHGKIAIGILIIQDLFAVLFLATASDTSPSLLALLLPLYLYILHFILKKLLNISGHGELLTIFGFFAAFVTGATVFYATGVKADIGALAAGMLLVNHKKADELYDRMMSYKDFFLIAFFVDIGLTGVPSINTILIALAIMPVMFLKGGLFMVLFSRFHLKARTAFLTSVSLGNFSEFGLIISMVAVKNNLIPSDWLMISAILMAGSFIISSPVNTKVHAIFDRYKHVILKLNTGKKIVDEAPISLGDAEFLVVGMGSIGEPAYKYLDQLYPGKVIGVDYKQDRVNEFINTGYNVIFGDTASSLFWSYGNTSKIKIVLLAMSDFNSNNNTLAEIHKMKKRKFKVAAVIHYLDEESLFKKQGVDFVYHYKSNIGADFADQTTKQMIF